MSINKESICFILTLLLCLSIHPQISYAQTLMNVLKEDPETSSFARALEISGLDQQLQDSGPFTIFAPTNDAFDDFTIGINPNSGRMRSILQNHIMTGLATERSIRVMTKATSLGGITLNIENDGNEILVNSARLVNSNIRAGNGVIHVIDRVLR